MGVLGTTGIGPKKYPYRSRSAYALAKGNANSIFYSSQPEEKLVPCPFDPEHPVGNSDRLTPVHRLVRCEDGRIPGNKFSGTAHLRYELACCAKLPPEQRHPLENVMAYSHSPEAAVCFYCRYPQKVDPSYVAPADPEGTEGEPLDVDLIAARSVLKEEVPTPPVQPINMDEAKGDTPLPNDK